MDHEISRIKSLATRYYEDWSVVDLQDRVALCNAVLAQLEQNYFTNSEDLRGSSVSKLSFSAY